MTWLQISCPLIQEVKSQGGEHWAVGQEGGRIVGRVVFRGQNEVVACLRPVFTAASPMLTCAMMPGDHE